MQAIDNSGVLGYNKNFDYSGFRPVMTYVWDATAKTVVCDTNAMVLPAVGGSAGTFHANIQVHDQYGGTKFGHIGPNAAIGTASAAIDISGLSPNKGINITATIVTKNGWSATGSAFDIVAGTAGGNLQDWNIAEAPASADPSLIV